MPPERPDQSSRRGTRDRLAEARQRAADARRRVADKSRAGFAGAEERIRRRLDERATARGEVVPFGPVPEPERGPVTMPAAAFPPPPVPAAARPLQPVTWPTPHPAVPPVSPPAPWGPPASTV